MVGSVNSIAHVEDVGNTILSLNRRLGVIWNPSGGMASAPEKNAKTFFKLMSE